MKKYRNIGRTCKCHKSHNGAKIIKNKLVKNKVMRLKEKLHRTK